MVVIKLIIISSGCSEVYLWIKVYQYVSPIKTMLGLKFNFKMNAADSFTVDKPFAEWYE